MIVKTTVRSPLEFVVRLGISFFLLYILVAGVSLAQPEPLTSAHRDTGIYAGPGNTYLQTGALLPDIEVSIVGRNRIGTWLHVMRQHDEGIAAIDGWVLAGALNLPANLRYSELPVSALPDASAEYRDSPSIMRLYSAPVIPLVSPAVREIYERGQALGNNSRVVTKVGDSLTADPLYLTPIRQTDYVLGPYDYLEETLNYFGPSTARSSVAARLGMTSLVVFDPMWANTELCEPNETPLACEYRIRQPSISFIMFGQNDVMHMTDAIFAGQMRQIIDETLARGIIPVLSTFIYHPDAEYWQESVNFNLALIDLASEYQIPLINLWAATQVLPEYGLEGDWVHMRHSGFRYLKFDSGLEARYGVSLRNLLSIRMLDEIRHTLEME